MNRRDALRSLVTLPMAATTIERKEPEIGLKPTAIQGTAFGGMNFHASVDFLCMPCRTLVPAGTWHDCPRKNS